MKKQPKKGWLSKEKLFPLLIIIVMTSSVIGFMWGRDSPSTLKYKDFNFLRKNNQWLLKTSNNDFIFDFFPSEVETIYISDEIKQKLRGTIEIDITYDVNSTYSEAIATAQYSLEQNLISFNIYLRKGFTSNNTYNLPIITCNDSTDVVPVIYFKDSNQTNIFLEKNCIIAEAGSEIGFIKIKDRLLYSYLGIIE